MDLSDLSLTQWSLAAVAALFVGIAKSGFGSVGMLTVILMASIMPDRVIESTGIVLPMLIIGDLIAIRTFRAHVRWDYVARLIPPALVGVVIGYIWMRHLSEGNFKSLIGWMILLLCGLQFMKQLYPALFNRAPHSRSFAYAAGTTAGITTMMANAAGPIMALYFLTVNLPKMALVGTSSWYFLVVNLSKVPFSAQMGFITPKTLLFNLLLAPLIYIGFLLGKAVLHRINQTTFERILLLLTIISALHLIFS